MGPLGTRSLLVKRASNGWYVCLNVIISSKGTQIRVFLFRLVYSYPYTKGVPDFKNAPAKMDDRTHTPQNAS